jgi:hypothetical protein
MGEQVRRPHEVHQLLIEHPTAGVRELFRLEQNIFGSKCSPAKRHQQYGAGRKNSQKLHG